MAAPQWGGGKCKTVQQVKAYFRHNTTDRRMEAQHTNPHINTRLTHLNFSVNGLSYRERCAAYDKRMGEIDQGKPGSGKNARTLMMSVILYPPTALLDDKPRLREWFMKAGEVAEARFGANMIDMAVDFDEIHEYRDKAGQLVISREHGHLWLVPEVGGKLNGKQFSSRAVINGFNAELQAMSIREFGCPMMDGTGKKGGQKVEVLKAESEAREIIAQAQAEAERMQRDAEQYKRAAEMNNRDLMRLIADQKKQQAELNREHDALFVARSQLKEDQEDARGRAQELVDEAKGKARVIIVQAEQEALKTAQKAAERAKADMDMAEAVLNGCKALASELTEDRRQRMAALDAQRQRIAAQSAAVLRNQGPDEPSPS